MRPKHPEFYAQKVFHALNSIDFFSQLCNNNTCCFDMNIATGEPPLCMAVSVFFALRNAIDAARNDAGNSEWFQMGNSRSN